MSVLRIGTRDSQLALWQAERVQKLLKNLNVDSVLVKVKSQGDLNLKQPLYQMGITGVFTKTLDLALLNDQIDIAVHSLKDVPTRLPSGLVQGAVLERGNSHDILILNNGRSIDELQNQKSSITIATGSLRRKAQWLRKYPLSQIEGLRGNVNLRLEKLVAQSKWFGAVFAKVGLQRVDQLTDRNFIELDWMIPAPAQGAVGILYKETNKAIDPIVSKLNHFNTQICTSIEREFLNVLEGGCSAPIGAHALIENDQLRFKAGVYSLDGQQAFLIDRTVSLDQYKGFGKFCAQELRNKGAGELIQSL